MGALDFAGGTVVHITSGFSALVASYMVGKRPGVESTKNHSIKPHKYPFSAQYH